MIAGCIERMRQSACGGCERRDACASLFEALRFDSPRKRPAARPELPPSARAKNPFMALLGEVAKVLEGRMKKQTGEFRDEIERRLEPMLASGARPDRPGRPRARLRPPDALPAAQGGRRHLRANPRRAPPPPRIALRARAGAHGEGKRLPPGLLRPRGFLPRLQALDGNQPARGPRQGPQLTGAGFHRPVIVPPTAHATVIGMCRPLRSGMPVSG